ncbi:MAG: SGNH/GDSL hydrolase family protein [Propioniciclava sp.]|uniref:SGNH/GDSL hydrolase family protein n=1 Tax=Propioniciclava sp. TaxID=2038686 RepID=UPI0039E5F259
MRLRQLLGLGVLVVITAVLVVVALWRSGPQGVPAVPATTPAAPPTSASAGPEGSGAPTASARIDPSATPATSASAAGAKTVVVLGDGYTLRSGWADALASATGWKVVTLAEDGMGYLAAPKSCTTAPCVTFAGAAARVAQHKPDAVVLAGGDADGDFKLDPHAQAGVAALKKAVPSATIVVTSPPSSRAPKPHWLTLHAKSLEKAAKQAKATWLDTSAVTGLPRSYDGGKLTPEASKKLADLVARALA